MSVIRVNPDSVRAYGAFAQERFDAMRLQLEALVREVVGVRYFGPNAAQFKTQCGEIASQFATSLSLDLDQIAQAVTQATMAIANSLGGSSVQLSVNPSPVHAPPVDPGDGTVDVDTSALEALKPVVASRFGSLTEGLQAHLSRLEATDWEGSAKDRAVTEVQSFTTAAWGKIDEAQTSITTTIDRQISAVLAADR